MYTTMLIFLQESFNYLNWWENYIRGTVKCAAGCPCNCLSGVLCAAWLICIKAGKIQLERTELQHRGFKILINFRRQRSVVFVIVCGGIHKCWCSQSFWVDELFGDVESSRSAIDLCDRAREQRKMNEHCKCLKALRGHFSHTLIGKT